jgi:hypothetical protein
MFSLKSKHKNISNWSKMLKSTFAIDWSSTLQIKIFLERNFSQRQAKKDNRLYIAINKIYEHHPNIVNMLLDNIPRLGYYKDYFHILNVASNADLIDRIYDIVLEQIRSDIKNLKLGQEISTLGKWLPREKSKLNKKLNFIKRFTKDFFPQIKKPSKAFAAYRKLKTKLNAKLGLIEINACSKDTSTIDFSKVSYNSLIKFKRKIELDPISSKKYALHQRQLLEQMSLKQLVIAQSSKHIPVQLIDEVFAAKDYFVEKFSGIDLSNAICIIDLSNDTFKTRNQHVAFGIAVHITKISKQNPCVYVGNKPVILTASFSNSIATLMKYVGPCKLTDKQNSTGKIILVTAKKINVVHNNLIVVDLCENICGPVSKKLSTKKVIRSLTSKIILKKKQNYFSKIFAAVGIIVIVIGICVWFSF